MREHLPGADGKIVFDKFHIAQHLGGAVDKVRRKENKILRADGDDTLVGTRYDWLRHPARMEPKDRRAFAVGNSSAPTSFRLGQRDKSTSSAFREGIQHWRPSGSSTAHSDEERLRRRNLSLAASAIRRHLHHSV